MKQFVLSYGAGVNSTALLVWLIKNKKPIDHIVFADTGDELPETYEYIEYIIPFIEKAGYKLTIVKNLKRESLFDRCFRRKVIPSQVWRWCTRDFKIRPIHRFYKSLRSHIVQYIAIDYDEIQRIKDSSKYWITNEYPLIDNKIGRIECMKIISEAGFQIPVKSGCYFCPYNNKERLDYIRQKHPALFENLIKLERNNKHYPKQKLLVFTKNEECSGHCMT